MAFPRLRHQHLVIVAIVAMSTLAGLAATAASETTGWVANPTFASETSSWTVSSYARLVAVESSDVPYGRLTSRDGKRTVSMTSLPSTKLLPEGSTTTLKLEVKTPKPTVKIGVEAQEVDVEGRVVASTTWTSSSGSSKWRSPTLILKTRGTGHRFAVRITAYSMSESKSLRIRAIDVTVVAPTPAPTPGPSATSGGSVPPSPTLSDVPVPGSTHGSADVRPCSTTQLEQLDYSLPGQGELAWADEFDGTSVDTSRWRIRNETTLSFDQARIMAANVGVSDGKLSITGRRESIGGRDFTTGYLDTIGKFSRQYGRWEIRAKLPTAPQISRGLWPAFWLRADQLPGEIDVMEAWGDPSSRTPNSLTSSYAWTVHENTNSPAGSQRFGGWGQLKDPIANSFHVWAVDWSPACLKFSMNGVTTGSVALGSAPWLVPSIAGPVNIRLNMQIGSSYWGMADTAAPDQTKLPASYLVDYVRVYRPLA